MKKLTTLEALGKIEFEGSDEELKKIIDFVGEISKISVEGFDKDPAVGLDSLRDDESAQGFSREEALLNAPKQKDGCYSVPLVVE